MKMTDDWRQNLRSWMDRRKFIPPSAQEDLLQFFEQAFRNAQEPSASWFGVHGGRVSLVIGNYFLAAVTANSRVYVLVDEIACAPRGCEIVPTGRSSLKWVYSPDLASLKHIISNSNLWAAYSKASRLALNSPDGRPRKDEFYRKRHKERLCDFWPEPGRSNLFQELEFQEPTLRNLSKTEYEAVRLSRIGQGWFRDSLLQLWGQCAVTGCADTRILRASHIKPWAASTNRERLDPYNGLLLIPNLDAALDAGLIAFDDTGKIQLSSQLGSQDASSLGIESKMKFSPIHKRHLRYLRYHRQRVFKR